MGRLLSGLVGIVGALWLGIAGAAGMYWWDREPARPAWTQAHFLFLGWPHWLRDPSLASESETWRRAYNTEQNSFDIESAAFAQIEAATRAISARGARVQASLEDAVARDRVQQAPAKRLETSIAGLEPESPASPCPGLDPADAVFRAYLEASR